MKKTVLCISLLVCLLLFLPFAVYAVDRTPEVSVLTSKVEIAEINISTYPYASIYDESPEDNFTRITVIFRDAESRLLHERSSDRVNFFIEPSGKDIIGWVDLNDNDEYEYGEEFTSEDISASKGYFVDQARLAKNSSVTFYIGSKTSGKISTAIYTADGKEKGELIDTVYTNIKASNVHISLTPNNEKGDKSLGGHAGTVKDPYQVTPGEGIVLKAYVSLSNQSMEGKDVIFYKSYEGGADTEANRDATDDEGLAEGDIREKNGGLYCFYAVTEGIVSKKIYVNYAPEEGTVINGIEPEGGDLTLGETYQIGFSIEDKYGNIIAGDKEENVVIEVTDAPNGSKYNSFLKLDKSNDEGTVMLDFTPDRTGDYTFRCKFADGSKYGNLNIDVIRFEAPVSMKLGLKASNVEVASVRYMDDNNDSVPDIAGRLEVKLEDAAGAEITANGNEEYRLTFASNNDSVEIQWDGDIIVKDKDFTGYVPVTVTEARTKLKGTFRVLIAGSPASLAQTVQIKDRKAVVNLQYYDSKGNKTTYIEGEDYTITVPEGIDYYNVKNFDRAGQASFTLLADEKEKYNITVSAGKSRLKKSFSVSFGGESAEEPAKKSGSIIMFIGRKSYTQNGEAKLTEVAPFISNGRTFVAIRPVAEAFDAGIEWNPSLQMATLIRDDLTVKITLGARFIEKTVNGITSRVAVDVPAFIQDGRTVLPFRAVGEAFGADVNYDPDSQAVSYTLD